MPFEITATDGQARVGKLTFARGKADQLASAGSSAAIDTPACFVPTNAGLPPHLTPDVLASLNAFNPGGMLLHVPLEHFLDSDAPTLVQFSASECKTARDERTKTRDLRAFVGLTPARLVGAPGNPATGAEEGAASGAAAVETAASTSASASVTSPTAPTSAPTPTPAISILMDLCDRGVDAADRHPKNTDKYACAKTFGGVVRTTPQLYMDVVRAARPDAIVALADHIYPSADTHANGVPSKKRTKNSVDRTLRWMEECSRLNREQLDVPMFVQIGGGPSEFERQRIVKEIGDRVQQKKLDIAGVLLSDSGLDAVPFGEKAALYAQSVSGLPADLPRIAYGCERPDHVPQLIQKCGADVVDLTKYIKDTTDKGRALTFSFTASGASGETDVAPTLHLFDKTRYASDLSPIVDGCECPACVGSVAAGYGAETNRRLPFTRAYINHLMNTHEMLGNTLLMLHNLHTVHKFLSDIRSSIAAGTLAADTAAFVAKYAFERDATDVDADEQAAFDAMKESLISAGNRLDS
ncbi:tRNA-guanine transglycosylase [Ramicandelaber brevisporus]|nr:tRNA-guanine transglycosylase [Ramicandelaber brevisporus]